MPVFCGPLVSVHVKTVQLMFVQKEIGKQCILQTSVEVYPFIHKENLS